MAQKGKIKHIDLGLGKEEGREMRGWGKRREGKCG